MSPLTVRQIKIMAEILSNEKIGLNSLSTKLNVSIRTIQEEVRLLNSFLEETKINIRIISETNDGYTYDKKKFSRKEYEFKKQCIAFNDNQLSVNIRNQRVIKIMFILLTRDNYIKSIDIANTLYISGTTLSNDLKEVRKILTNYNLEIISIPYKGIIIEGEHNAKISCILDYCNLYNLNESLDYLGSNSCEMLKIKKEFLLDTKKKLNKILKATNYRVPEESFKRLILYLNMDHKLEIKSVDVEIKELLDLSEKELSIAKKLLPISAPNELYNFAAFIFINSDSISNKLWKILDNKTLKLKYNRTESFIKKNIGLELNDSKEFKQVILKLILNEYIKDKLHFFHRAYSAEKLQLVSHLNITNIISFMILDNLDKEFQNSLTINNLSNISLQLYNIIAIIPNPHEKLHILMINNYGLSMNKSFAYRVDLDTNYVQLHHHYEHELEEMNLNNYQAIVSTSNDLIIPKQYNIPYFKFDYYSDEKEGKKIWDKITVDKKRKNLIGEKLSNITTVELEDSEKELFNYLNEKIPNATHKKILKDWWNYSLLLNPDGPMYIYSFNNMGDSNVERIILEKNAAFDDIKTIYFLNLNLNYKYLTVKQADSIIRGFT